MTKFNERGCLALKRHVTWRYLSALSASLMLALCSSCFARIGETPEQAEQRYGKPVEQSGEWYRYEKAPFIVSLHFFHGKADMVGYAKIEQKADKPVELSESEINTLLDINSGGAKWTRKFINVDDPEWYSWHAHLHAVHVTQTHTLFILTNDAADRAKQAQIDEKKGEFEGF